MSNKQAQANKLPPKPVTLDDFNQVEVKLTDVENQLLANTERRKAMLINNVATMFAEELQHITAMFAKKKNIQYSDELFAGVFYDAPKGRAYILQYKSKEAAAAAKPQQQ
jgi:tRNA isopentenyl-2-thiomethyl-A-37 hydroxylase MiaE